MKNLLLFACGLLSAGAAFADDAAILACRAQADTARRLACYDAIPLGAVSAPTRQETEASSIRSTIVGRFDGWGPRSIITLANGQVWKITDDSEAVMQPMQDPKVEISRGLLAGHYLQVQGYNNTARVKRVK
jgi:hypothetical protein